MFLYENATALYTVYYIYRDVIFYMCYTYAIWLSILQSADSTLNEKYTKVGCIFVFTREGFDFPCEIIGIKKLN